MIVVVRTWVCPSMCPPTMKTAPTSETARPKPTMTAVRTPAAASRSTVIESWYRSAPRTVAVSFTRRSTVETTDVVIPRMIGVTITTCATTIPRGVYRRPRGPRGPPRESTRKTRRPARTGGRPYSVNRMFRSRRALPTSRRPRAVPMGTAIAVETTVDVPETRRERAVIPRMSPATSARPNAVRGEDCVAAHREVPDEPLGPRENEPPGERERLVGMDAGMERRVDRNHGVRVPEDRLVPRIVEAEEREVRLERVPGAIIGQGVRVLVVRDRQGRPHSLVRPLVPCPEGRPVEARGGPQLELLRVRPGVVRAGFEEGAVLVDSSEGVRGGGRGGDAGGVGDGPDDHEPV